MQFMFMIRSERTPHKLFYLAEFLWSCSNFLCKNIRNSARIMKRTVFLLCYNSVGVQGDNTLQAA